MVQRFNSNQHPDVLAQRTTAKDIQKQFLESFDTGGVVEGKVTRQEFLQYYANIGASITNDIFFETMLRNVWGVPRNPLSPIVNGNSPAMKAGNDSVGTRLTCRPVPSLMNQLAKPQLSRSTPNIDCGEVKSRTPLEIAQEGPNPISTSIRAGEFIPRTSGVKPVVLLVPKDSLSLSVVGQIPPGIKYLVDKMKSDVMNRGMYGYADMQRMFYLLDEDNTNTLDLNEFKNVLKETGTTASEREIRMVSLVKAAFSGVDRRGRGIVSAEDVASQYSSRNHPEVVSGRQTEQRAMSEFLQSFDVGREVEGFVTQQEFINFYSNIGMCISSDDYFELMICNCWSLDQNERNVSDSTASKLRGNMAVAGIILKWR